MPPISFALGTTYARELRKRKSPFSCRRLVRAIGPSVFMPTGGCLVCSVLMCGSVWWISYFSFFAPGTSNIRKRETLGEKEKEKDTETNVWHIKSQVARKWTVFLFLFLCAPLSCSFIWPEARFPMLCFTRIEVAPGLQQQSRFVNGYV